MTQDGKEPQEPQGHVHGPQSSHGHHHHQHAAGESTAAIPYDPKIMALLEQMNAASLNTTKKQGKNQEDYAFWNTQPVPKMDEEIKEIGAIEPDVPFDQIPKEPLNLPGSFEWDEMDVHDPKQLDELAEFLADNYLEDFQSTFRMVYSNALLKWALTPPGWLRTWHPCVRVKGTKKLVGFIAALPIEVQIYDKTKKMVEINFLCVHKKLRAKRLAPVLIREITRRVHLQGLFQAFYTAGVMLPKPISDCQYFHRQINPKKLIETDFSYLKKNMTMARTIKLHKLPDNPQLPGFREAKPEDVPQMMALYEKYMKKFDFYPRFSKEEAQHYLQSVPDAVSMYVVEDPTTKKITDFIGYFTINNQVLNNSQHKSIKSAFMWYYAPRSMDNLHDLINDAIIAAKNTDHDVFNCMALMDNEPLLKELKFGPGDATLRFYLYNYRCPAVPGNKQAFLII